MQCAANYNGFLMRVISSFEHFHISFIGLYLQYFNTVDFLHFSILAISFMNIYFLEVLLSDLMISLCHLSNRHLVMVMITVIDDL